MAMGLTRAGAFGRVAGIVSRRGPASLRPTGLHLCAPKGLSTVAAPTSLGAATPSWGSSLLSWLKSPTYPMTFAILFAGAKCLVADEFVQRVLEGKTEIDRRRSLLFTGFGFFQVGWVQYMLYSRAYPFLFPVRAAMEAAPLAQRLRDFQGMRQLATMVAIDQLVYHPACYFPVFYTFQEILHLDPDGALRDVLGIPGRAFESWKKNVVTDLKALWCIFVPVSIVQCSVVPVHLRVQFVATVGFVWSVVLSAMHGNDKHAVAAPSPPPEHPPAEEHVEEGTPNELFAFVMAPAPATEGALSVPSRVLASIVPGVMLLERLGSPLASTSPLEARRAVRSRQEQEQEQEQPRELDAAPADAKEQSSAPKEKRECGDDRCPICLDPCTQRVQLACSHSICHDCTLNLSSYDLQQRCPVCRHPHLLDPSILRERHAKWRLAYTGFRQGLPKGAKGEFNTVAIPKFKHLDAAYIARARNAPPKPEAGVVDLHSTAAGDLILPAARRPMERERPTTVERLVPSSSPPCKQVLAASAGKPKTFGLIGKSRTGLDSFSLHRVAEPEPGNCSDSDDDDFDDNAQLQKALASSPSVSRAARRSAAALVGSSGPEELVR